MITSNLIATEWPEEPMPERIHRCLKMLWLRDFITDSEMEIIRYKINAKYGLHNEDQT